MSHKSKTEEKEATPSKKLTKEQKKKQEDKTRRLKEQEKRRSDIADRLRNELGEKGFFLPSSAFRRELQERTRAIRVLQLQDDSSSDEDEEEEYYRVRKRKEEEDLLRKKKEHGGSRGKRDLSRVASLMMLRSRKLPLPESSGGVDPSSSPLSPRKAGRSASLEPVDISPREEKTRRSNSLEPSPLLQRKSGPWYHKFHKTPSSENLIKKMEKEIEKDPSLAFELPTIKEVPDSGDAPPVSPRRRQQHQQSKTPDLSDKKPKTHRRNKSDVPHSEKVKKHKPIKLSDSPTATKRTKPQEPEHPSPVFGSAPEKSFLTVDPRPKDGGEDKPKKKTKKHKRTASKNDDSSSSRHNKPPATDPPVSPRRRGHTSSASTGHKPAEHSTSSSFRLAGTAPSASSIKGAPVIEIVEKIGKGSHGVVWKGFIDSKPVALKQISLEGVKDGRAMRHELKAEVDMMKKINHPFILRYFGLYYSRATQEVNLVLELMEGGTLANLIKKLGPVSEQTAAQVTYQIVTALQFLKDTKIIHRDVKPDNMLLTEDGIVKLCDFGEATQITMEVARRSTVGTPWYCAPEIINGDEYSYASDLWSVGCCVIEMITGSPPFSEYNPVQALFKMAEEEIPRPVSGTNCKSFLNACLQRDWQQRPTAEELLKHPFLSNVNNKHDQVQKLVQQLKQKNAEEAAAGSSVSSSASSPAATPPMAIPESRRTPSPPPPSNQISKDVSSPVHPGDSSPKLLPESPLRRSQENHKTKKPSSPRKRSHEGAKDENPDGPSKSEEEKKEKKRKEKEARKKEKEEKKRRKEKEKEKEREMERKREQEREQEQKQKEKEREEREKQKEREKQREKEREEERVKEAAAIAALMQEAETEEEEPVADEGHPQNTNGSTSPTETHKNAAWASRRASVKRSSYGDLFSDDVFWNGKKSADKRLSKSDMQAQEENGHGHRPASVILIGNSVPEGLETGKKKSAGSALSPRRHRRPTGGEESASSAAPPAVIKEGPQKQQQQQNNSAESSKPLRGRSSTSPASAPPSPLLLRSPPPSPHSQEAYSPKSKTTTTTTTPAVTTTTVFSQAGRGDEDAYSFG